MYKQQHRHSVTFCACSYILTFSLLGPPEEMESAAGRPVQLVTGCTSIPCTLHGRAWWGVRGCDGCQWVFGTAAYTHGKKAEDSLRRGSFQPGRLGR